MKAINFGNLSLSKLVSWKLKCSCTNLSIPVCIMFAFGKVYLYRGCQRVFTWLVYSASSGELSQVINMHIGCLHSLLRDGRDGQLAFLYEVHELGLFGHIQNRQTIMSTTTRLIDMYPQELEPPKCAQCRWKSLLAIGTGFALLSCTKPPRINSSTTTCLLSVTNRKVPTCSTSSRL